MGQNEPKTMEKIHCKKKKKFKKLFQQNNLLPRGLKFFIFSLVNLKF